MSLLPPSLRSQFRSRLPEINISGQDARRFSSSRRTTTSAHGGPDNRARARARRLRNSRTMLIGSSRKVVLNVESVDAEEIESGQQEIPNKRLVVRNNDDVT